MNKGTLVRMSAALKAKMSANCSPGKHVAEVIDGCGDSCYACSLGHVLEFGSSVGVVQGPTDYNACKSDEPEYDESKLGPEVDVRWLPDMLRYAYAPSDLEEVHVVAAQQTFHVSAAMLDSDPTSWGGYVDGVFQDAYRQTTDGALRSAIANKLRAIADDIAYSIKLDGTIQLTFIVRPT